MRICLTVRVHTRRALRSDGATKFFRVSRRASRIASQALVLGAAPSMLTDMLVEHFTLSNKLVSHDMIGTLWNTVIATAIYDTYLIFQLLR